MITEYLHQFLTILFDAPSVEMLFAVDYLAIGLSSLLCTIPAFLIIRLIMGDRTSKVCYIALNIALCALQAYSFNGGIL